MLYWPVDVERVFVTAAGCHMVVHDRPSNLQTVHSKRAISAGSFELEARSFRHV